MPCCRAAVVYCGGLNNPALDNVYVSAGNPALSVNAGETVTVMASNPVEGATGVEITVNGVQVASSSTFPATLTYTFPSGGTFPFGYGSIGRFGFVKWQVSCGR